MVCMVNIPLNSSNPPLFDPNVLCNWLFSIYHENELHKLLKM